MDLNLSRTNRSCNQKENQTPPHQVKERTEGSKSMRRAQTNMVFDNGSTEWYKQFCHPVDPPTPTWEAYEEFVNMYYPEKHIAYDGTQQGLKKTVSKISRMKRRSMDKKMNFQLQADVSVGGTLDDNAPEEETVTNENISFIHEGRANEMTFSGVMDHTFTQDKSGMADLQDFLSRPVPIATYTWPENGSVLNLQTLQPWLLFFNDTRIKKKLDNFAYLKCTLKIKFVINASPFYYGAIGAFYRPLSGAWDNLTTAATQYQIQIPISQRPHVWMNPQEVSTAEMTLPFFTPNNWLRVGVAADFSAFGTLDLWQFSKLRSANGATTAGVTITTYAWAEDVVVAGPTVALSLQARTVHNASEKWWKPSGQISQMASKVAAAAPSLGKLGTIGEYAGKTIESVADSVGSISSIFGFSNLPVITDAMPFKSLPFHSIASSEVSEPVERLTLDPKQALDLDSTKVGLDGTDELGISYICQKESFLTGCLWTDAYATDTLIFSSRVTPQLFDVRSIVAAAQLYDTPMSYVSRMFKNWRGDVIFRFKFIRSMYHRGRVRITWDPFGAINTDANSTTVAYTKIVDLDVDDEVELRVPFIAVTPFLDLITNNVTRQWSATPTGVTPNAANANGLITVRVLNGLTGPVTGTEIDMLVFVRAGENLEFAAPIDLNPRMSSFAVQSKVVSMTNGKSADADDLYGAVFGERYATLRQLMRRSCRSFTIKPPVLTGNLNTSSVSWILSPTPEINGYAPGGMHVATGTISGSNVRYNFVNRIPLSHISQMFIGRRGSMNWHLNLDGAPTSSEFGGLIVERSPFVPTTTTRNNIVTYDSAAATSSKFAYANVMRSNNFTSRGTGACGAAMTNQLTQAGVSINMPDYSLTRFHIINPSTSFSNEAVGGEKFAASAVMNLTEYATAQLTGYCSAGPDFNLLFWMNTPDLYYYDTLPGYGSGEPTIATQQLP